MLTKFCIAVAISLAATSSSLAHDSERLDFLESELIETQKRLNETRKRLAILESQLRNGGTITAPSTSGSATGGSASPSESEVPETDTSFTGWKVLSTGMSTGKVRQILGDPQRIEGHKNSTWYYEDGGSLVFWDGYLKKWTEPE